MYDICKNKRVCEGGQQQEENQDNNEETEDIEGNKKKKKPHNGCGAEQPKVSRDGLKISIEYKKEQENGEQRKVLTAEEVMIDDISFWIRDLTCFRCTIF